MEQSVCPVSIKIPGHFFRDSGKHDSTLFQDLMQAGISAFKDMEKPMEGKRPVVEIPEIHEESKGEGSSEGIGEDACSWSIAIGLCYQEISEKLVLSTSGTHDDLKGGIPVEEGSSKEIAGNTQLVEQGVEEILSAKMTSSERLTAIEKGFAMESRPMPSGEELSGKRSESGSTDMEFKNVFLSLKEEINASPTKPAGNEQEKIFHFLHQEGVRAPVEAGMKNTAEAQGSEQILEKNLAAFETEMIKSFETIREGETSLMKIMLEPKNLGKVELQLRMVDGKLRGSIIVENERVRELFGDRMVELGGRLNSQNITVEDLKVVVREDFRTPMNMDHDGRQGQQRHQQKMQYHNGALMRSGEFERSDGDRFDGISVLA
jgi:hypothetical protein